MLNIIKADFFRLRKGKAIYAVLLGMFGIIMAMTFLLSAISIGWVSEENQVLNGSGIVTIESTDEEVQDNAELLASLVPENGAEFVSSMYSDMGSIMNMFVLVFIIVVFGVDYSSHTYKNILSYHTKRSKIYLSKIGLSSLLAIGSLLIWGLISFVIGGISFGFQGYNAENILPMITGVALMIPMLLAFVSIGYCLVVFTKKTSATIATYIIGGITIGTVLQIAALMFPAKRWIPRLDLASSMGEMMKYQTLETLDIMIPMGIAVVLIILTTGIGLYKYKKTDFDLN